MKQLIEKCPKCGKDLFVWSDGNDFGEYCDGCGYSTQNGEVLSTAFLDYTEAYKKYYEGMSNSHCAKCGKEIPKRMELIVDIPEKRDQNIIYDKFLCPNCIIPELDELDQQGIINITLESCKSCNLRDFAVCCDNTLGELNLLKESKEKCEECDWNECCIHCGSESIKERAREPRIYDGIEYECIEYECNSCNKTFSITEELD